ncbi:MAG TPA: A/G-specific adenine glycosylase [Longimicrobiales bacterium]|nr:A/G-specific adenine glycosylase [Longimicrobiales bacterium]
MTEPLFSDDVAAAIRAALLAFFDASGRDLPWRRTRDPYAIWISEVMAQQTRVETVIPYWERWLARFPDVAALADAPADDVLKAWEGLGYYSRARNLHSAARVVRERHNGALPGTYDALRTLPGVGDYTAGAVASIAFDAREPAVDGNVRRVLSRLLDEPAPSPARLRAAAARLVPATRPGDFNQALMELGARICTPRSPKCARCPVAAHCAARAAGTQLERPAPRVRKTLPVIDVATAVLRRADGAVLLVRRPARGLLAGMWTFPGLELAPADVVEDAVRALAASHGTALSAPRHIGDVEHTFSHRRERYICHELAIEPTSEPGATVWLGADRSKLTLSRAQQRVHALAFAAATTPWEASA